MHKPKTFRIETLGCRTNQYEAQAYHDQLVALGHTPAKENEPAELCIVNTCTVTESADSSSRHAIRQLARQNQGSQLIVTGCYAEQNRDKVLALEGVTAVVANKDKEQLLPKLFPSEEWPEFKIDHFEAHTRAFVKVQDGCNSFCTYCVIPYVRGRSHSRSLSEIVAEVEQLISNGFKEVVLTGINIGDFDGNRSKEETPVRLVDLVKAVDALPGLERLRISSIDPDEVDEELADAVLNGKVTAPSMHLVLQSGSNVILKRMNRKYTRQIFLSTVEKLKTACPDFTITTDLIVGFPGETEADFAESLAVMEEVQFAKVHMFPYSDRPRTRAATMPNKVPHAVMQERKQQVLELAERHAFSLRETFLKRKMPVLTERNDFAVSGYTTGHTANFLPVLIPRDIPANSMITVELIQNTPTGLIGVICE